MATLLLYGSYGYVGNLVAHEAIARGLRPVLAGRDRSALAEQAEQLDCPARNFDLSERADIDQHLEFVDCVLNCAGPFSNTADPLVDACLRTGTDYVDITGEIPVIERIQRWDDIARDRDVTLFPSVGLSSVPMDCLAAHLTRRAPDAEALALGAESFRIPSVGSIKTAIEGIDTGGAVRRDGRLHYVPAGWKTRRIDFGRGERPAATMPLGDVSTAHYTTGIPDIDVYVGLLPPARLALAAHSYAKPILASGPVQGVLKRVAELVRTGPSQRARERGSVYFWGEARSDDGRVVSRLRTPDAYVVTPDAAVTVAQRVLDGAVDAGYRTPAGTFGPEFVFELDGVEGFEDEHPRDVRRGPAQPAGTAGRE